uniref:DNA polymerase III subunit epsilon n=1 Tax=Gongylonema pulchrum TaxID=637853 RepID=A0A183DFT7_9BILA
LMEYFGKVKSEIHEALCDSVDTRTVIEKLRDLIAVGNAYINDMVSIDFYFLFCAINIK